MARRRFFVDEVHSGRAVIEGDDAQHLTRVLRVEVGQSFEISDNRQIYLAEVTTARKSQVVFEVKEKIAAAPPEARLELYAALIKFDHFEWMVEKATELGVARIVPVIAVRTERGLDKAAQKRVERWRRIAMEASQQSRRDFLPDVELPVTVREAAKADVGVRVLLDEEKSAPGILTVLPPVRSVEDTIALAVGPEGGWTPEERQEMIVGGWRPASLGQRILRAETACLAGLSVVSAMWR